MNTSPKPSPFQQPIGICESLWRSMPADKIVELIRQHGNELSDRLETDRISPTIMFPAGWRMRNFREEFFRGLANVLSATFGSERLAVKMWGVHAHVEILSEAGNPVRLLFVYHGDWATGVPHKQSRTMHRVSHVEIGEHLELDKVNFDRDSSAPRLANDWHEPEQQVPIESMLVVVMVHFDQKANEVRMELGIPSHRDQHGRITKWLETLKLPSVSLGSPPPSPQSDVDVTVRRKRKKPTQDDQDGERKQA